MKNISDVSMSRKPIPKVIHYCWFGRGRLLPLMKRCMASWSKYCPEWEIVRWDEDNFDVNFCSYTEKAYQERKYSFLSDAARLKIIYENGGIYLDTDVELIRPLDELLENDAWFGYGMVTEINTGCGFGSVKGHPMVKKLLDQYLSFDEPITFDLCTTLDTRVFREVLPEFAADHDIRQDLCVNEGGQNADVLILNNIWYYVIHHYTNTWLPWYKRFYNFLKIMVRKFLKMIRRRKVH